MSCVMCGVTLLWHGTTKTKDQQDRASRHQFGGGTAGGVVEPGKYATRHPKRRKMILFHYVIFILSWATLFLHEPQSFVESTWVNVGGRCSFASRELQRFNPFVKFNHMVGTSSQLFIACDTLVSDLGHKWGFMMRQSNFHTTYPIGLGLLKSV